MLPLSDVPLQGVSWYLASRCVGLWMSMQYVWSVPPSSTDISNRPAETGWSSPWSWMTALTVRLQAAERGGRAALALRGLVGDGRTGAGHRAAVATSPDTSAAARRGGPPPACATDDDAENAENTEFPFGQDPLTWGVTVAGIHAAESEAP